MNGELNITNGELWRRCERFTTNLVRYRPQQLTHCPQILQDLRFCNVNVDMTVGLKWLEVEGMLDSYEMRGS
jgi:hypothetical protein